MERMGAALDTGSGLGTAVTIAIRTKAVNRTVVVLTATIVAVMSIVDSRCVASKRETLLRIASTTCIDNG